MSALMTNSKPVSLRPSDSVDPKISELTAGDVIRMYHSQEAKRKRNDDDYAQSDIPVSFRSAPEGLLEVIEEITSVTGMRKAVITKCLSHHAMSWYQSMPRVACLARLYKGIHTKLDGSPDIIRKISRDDYEFVHPRPLADKVSSLRTVSFVLGFFSDTGKAVGVPEYKLFLAGLCWSISTNTDGWASSTVSRFLLPEAENMKSYLGERILTLDYADRVLRLRQRDPEMVEFVGDMERGCGTQ